MKRIQKLPPIMNTVDWQNLGDKNTYFWYYVPNAALPCRNVCPSIEDAMQKIQRAEKAGYEAYVSCFVPMYKQHAVIAMTPNGRLRDAFMAGPGKQVNAAYKALNGITETVSNNTMPIQKIATVHTAETENLLVCTAECIFDDEQMTIPAEQCRIWTFKTNEKLSKGDHRSCVTKKGRKSSVMVIRPLEAKPVNELPHDIEWYTPLMDKWLPEHQQAWEAHIKKMENRMGFLKRTPALGVLNEQQMAEAKAWVNSMNFG